VLKGLKLASHFITIIEIAVFQIQQFVLTNDENLDGEEKKYSIKCIYFCSFKVDTAIFVEVKLKD